jgi:hypothetical protein
MTAAALHADVWSAFATTSSLPGAFAPMTEQLDRFARMSIGTPDVDVASKARHRQSAPSPQAAHLTSSAPDHDPISAATSRGLGLDIDAATAAGTLPFHNGRTEGVNTKMMTGDRLSGPGWGGCGAPLLVGAGHIRNP